MQQNPKIVISLTSCNFRLEEYRINQRLYHSPGPIAYRNHTLNIVISRLKYPAGLLSCEVRARTPNFRRLPRSVTTQHPKCAQSRSEHPPVELISPPLGPYNTGPDCSWMGPRPYMLFEHTSVPCVSFQKPHHSFRPPGRHQHTKKAVGFNADNLVLSGCCSTAETLAFSSR